MRGKLMAGLVLLLCSVALQAEQIYRWVDADGGVHYSSAPPPGQAAESEDLKFLRNPDPEKASERIKGYDETAEKRRAAEAQAAEAATKQRQELPRHGPASTNSATDGAGAQRRAIFAIHPSCAAESRALWVCMKRARRCT